jgi:hypothetical protein
LGSSAYWKIEQLWRDGVKVEKMKCSRRFAYYACEHPAFVALVGAALVGYSLGRSGVKTNDLSIRRNAVCNLLAAMAADGPLGLPVAISRAKEHWFLDQYPRGHITALDWLIEGEWVCVVDPSTKGRLERVEDDPRRGPQSATFGLTLKAFEMLGEGFDYTTFRRKPSAPISASIKTPKGKKRLVIDEKHLAPLRAELLPYNSLLSGLEFSLGGEAIPWWMFELHRVFNSKDLLSGGRFYSDFCSVESSTRSTLTINGKPAIQADFSALHARLGLTIAGVSFPENEDPYMVVGQSRNEVKRVFTVLFNSKSGRSKEVDDDLANKGHNPHQIRRAVFGKFPELKELLTHQIGVKLQRADAEAVSVLLNAFTKAGKPLLPVHDGFYLLAEDRALFEVTMAKAQGALWGVLRKTWPQIEPVALPLSWS